VEPYKSYFISKYRNTKSLKPKTGVFNIKPKFFRKKAPWKIYLLPSLLLLLSLFFYTNPVFTHDREDSVNKGVPDLEYYIEEEEKEIENSEISNVYIQMDEIGDLVGENEDDLLVNDPNPYYPVAVSLAEHCRNFGAYEIKKGDTLWAIARFYKISIDSLISANKVISLYQIQPGKPLKIPRVNGIFYRVKKYDTLFSIAEQKKISHEEIKKYNSIGSFLKIGNELFLPGGKLNRAEKDLVFGGFFISPVKTGYLSSKYGMRVHPVKKKKIFHTGIDIAGNHSGKVLASSEGRVIHAGEFGSYGNYIRIRHALGFESTYAHLKTIKVKKGRRVRKGDVIGEVGNSGLSTGPHLHFEIKQKNRFVNPTRFIKFKRLRV